jgi:hypothetical protein
MSRILTALFDTRADAEAARSRLLATDIDADQVLLYDQDSAGYTNNPSTKPDTGIWASIKNAFLPEDDRNVYEEGMRRGGTLLTADVDEDEVDNAIGVLEDANGIDMDSRTGDWHASGWTAPVGAAAGMATAPVIERDRFASGRSDTDMGHDAMIPIVEEQIPIGKREVARGGARVRSYIVETPVNE